MNKSMMKFIESTNFNEDSLQHFEDIETFSLNSQEDEALDSLFGDKEQEIKDNVGILLDMNAEEFENLEVRGCVQNKYDDDIVDDLWQVYDKATDTMYTYDNNTDSLYDIIENWSQHPELNEKFNESEEGGCGEMSATATPSTGNNLLDAAPEHMCSAERIRDAERHPKDLIGDAIKKELGKHYKESEDPLDEEKSDFANTICTEIAKLYKKYNFTPTSGKVFDADDLNHCVDVLISCGIVPIGKKLEESFAMPGGVKTEKPTEYEKWLDNKRKSNGSNKWTKKKCPDGSFIYERYLGDKCLQREHVQAYEVPFFEKYISEMDNGDIKIDLLESMLNVKK